MARATVFSDILGKTLKKAYTEDYKDALTLVAEDGTTFRFAHRQECCEYVHIEDIEGDLSDLVNKYYDHRTEELMRVVKKSCMGIPTSRGTKECLRIQEPVAWQFYDKGEWYNGSNHHEHRKNTIKAGYRTRDLYPVQSSASIIVPDEMKEHQAAYQGCHHNLSTAFMEGANWMREEVLRLNSGKLVL